MIPEDIYLIHENAKAFLKDGGKIIHLISPSDHRAYSDKSLSLWDFLQYNQTQWDLIYTRFDYHNRLRLPHYIEIFDKTGFKILHESHSNPSKKPSNFPEKIDPEFNSLVFKDLTAGSLFFILEKK